MNIIAQNKQNAKFFERILPTFVFILLIIQPLLDALSYWADLYSLTSFTTVLRFFMLVCVTLYAFCLSGKKRVYLIFAGIVAVYWIAHMVICFTAKGGYISPVADMNNLLRTAQFPLFTICFITFFKNSDEVPGRIQKAFFFNMVILVHIIALSYMTRTQVYTYPSIKAGIMGWASCHNAQSAIFSLIVPLLLSFAYKTGNKFMFYGSCLLSFSVLYFVGTKACYFSIFIIAAAMAVVFLLIKERRIFYYVSILAIALACLLCYNFSVASQRAATYKDSMSEKQEYVNIAIDSVPETEDIDVDDPEQAKELQEEKKKDRISDLYSIYAGGMVNRFGFDRVYNAFGKTSDLFELTNQRHKKEMFADMVWNDSSALTHLFGYEYSALIENYTVEDEDGNIKEISDVFDLENDFPAILYNFGYVGLGMYLIFFAYFGFLIIRALIKNFKKVVSIEFAMVTASYLLSIGIAQFSGNLLKRPNASIYLSAIFAYIYYLTVVRINKPASEEESENALSRE